VFARKGQSSRKDPRIGADADTRAIAFGSIATRCRRVLTVEDLPGST